MSFTAVASQAPETHSSNVVRIDIQDLIRRIHADYTILDGIPDSVARELLQNIHEYPVRSVLMEE